MSERKLTAKQERFVAEYMIDLNATAAARRAGYSERNADKIGPQLLGKTRVAAAIEAARDQQQRRLKIEADDVLREVLLLARSDIGQVLDFSGPEPKLRPACEIPEHARRAIASMKVKRHMEGTGDYAREVEVTEFKLWDKLSALDKLCRHLGLYAAQEVKGTLELSGGLAITPAAVIQAGQELETTLRERASLNGHAGTTVASPP